MSAQSLYDSMLLIRDAALKAVNPEQAVHRAMVWEGPGTLRAGAQTWVLEDTERIYVLAVGKAAAPMTRAASNILEERLSGGLVVTKYGHAEGYAFPPGVTVYESGHPVPDAAGLAAVDAVMRLIFSLREKDRLVLLLSGGASALLPAPAGNLTLEDVRQVTQVLLRAGASINEINTVRKHLDRLKGGQLARLMIQQGIAGLSVLALSDVVGDPIEVIASGPACADPTTFQDAWHVLTRYQAVDQFPANARQYLRDGTFGQRPETPKPGDSLFSRVSHQVVASNRLAARAAIAKAAELGYPGLLLTTYLEGEAREAGIFAAALAKGILYQGDPLPKPACLVWGGETTVTLRGKGQGGRNQELALSAAVALEGLPDVCLMALATDGTDGPTDAAGAIVTGQTAPLARALKLDPVAALRENDSYPLLDRTGALMRTGPTGTNVNDLMVLLVGS